MKTAEELTNKRKGIRAQVTRIMTRATNVSDPPTLAHAEYDLQEVKRLKESYEAVQEDIIEINEDAKVKADQEKIGEEYEDIFRKAIVFFMQLIRRLTLPPGNVNNANARANQIKLPTIELPTFDGKFDEWMSFKDLFQATVGSNNLLGGAQKLQYLVASLKGEAAALVKSLPITDDNYKVAWKIVDERYDNKQEIVASVLNRLFDQQVITSESAAALRRLLDTTLECRRSLEVLQRPVQHWDDVFVHLVTKRLDSETRRRWVMACSANELPSFEQLTKFLDLYIRGLATDGANSQRSSFHQQQRTMSHTSAPGKKVVHHALSSSAPPCPVCKGSHPIFKCEKFLAMPASQRSTFVKEALLCFNCLRSGHGSAQCSNSHKCRKCGNNHHTLLHRDQAPAERPDATAATVLSNVLAAGVGVDPQHQVLLATAVVGVKDASGSMQQCRVLLDSGSQASFVTEQCTVRLGLQRKKTNVIVKGIGESASAPARGRVIVTMQSRFQDSSVMVEALILARVTSHLPNHPCSSKQLPHLRGLQLADDQYFKPARIDILLGADYVGAVLTDGKRVGPVNTPTALNSIFGWVLTGRITSAPPSQLQVNHCQVEEILQRFWKVEELPKIKHLTAEERACEEHFVKTHHRNADGRFVVQLPVKESISQLGDSKAAAAKRLNQVERRLASNPVLRQQYSAFMEEFISLGHMELVINGSESHQQFYLPHHCVLKPSSTSTKLRVVFDGSAKSSSGLSLNDCLRVGPTVQDDLFTLLLRFRTHLIALKADISKMYRQFEVAEHQQDLQRILWRTSVQDPVQVFKMTRVTYGTAAAPYLATKCLQQLSIEGKSRFPVAAAALRHDFYVDDLLTGQFTPEAAIHLQKQLSALLRTAGMELTKWASNSAEVLSTIPVASQEQVEAVPFDSEPVQSTIKALGICWNPVRDSFTFKGLKKLQHSAITKRILLSELAKVFDPLGFLSPVTVRAKILFQYLWQLKVDWDDEVPAQVQQQWESYQEDLVLVEQIHIPRCIVAPATAVTQIHGFSDGSESAYGAAVYLRTEQPDGGIIARLVTSKSKVAPLKQLSVPRLELCGAVMLTSLVASVQEAIKFDGAVILWSDSATVLKWIAASPSRWKTFVANRVAEVQDLFPAEHWRYVNTRENPADLLTRGIPAADLQSSKLWWEGPEWLSSHQLPSYSYDSMKSVTEKEQRPVKVLMTEIQQPPQLWSKYSSLQKLIRVTAFLQRFISNCRRKDEYRFGPLTPQELQAAQSAIIRQVQFQKFGQELQQLASQQPIKKTSKLLNLAPFLDHDRLIRVGGRLQNAELHEEVKHPLILPHSHPFTTLLIRHHHQQQLHGGPKMTQAALQRQFWILRSRDAVRHEIRRCAICRRQRGETASQFMGNLPALRVRPGVVFENCGVDYAGPFLARDRGRGKTRFKVYVCVIVCLSVKAVHLELVSELSTAAFIAALRRFIGRRGRPSHMLSDCGTNFVGADKELQLLVSQAAHNSIINHQLASEGISWKFNPPGAPHQGGLWEAAVKSFKVHFRRVVGAATLTCEEFGTMLCQIEASLNSRPLCPLSSDPSDLHSLTPGHFLIGRPVTALPESDLTHLQLNRLSRWQLVQQATQHFWRRWSSEYLNTLQQRFKWSTRHQNLQVADLVLIRDENQPPTKWAMGRVIAVHPGADQLVRVVTLRTQAGELKRPIHKLCLLLDSDPEPATDTPAENKPCNNS